MPYSTEWTDKGVQWIYTGIVTGTDMLRSNIEVYGDERFDDMRYQLVNFLNAESFDMTTEEVKEIAYRDKVAARSNPRVNVAVVATNDVIQALTRLYAEYSGSSPWKTELFETVEEAKKWLGIA